MPNKTFYKRLIAAKRKETTKNIFVSFVGGSKNMRKMYNDTILCDIDFFPTDLSDIRRLEKVLMLNHDLEEVCIYNYKIM